MNDKNFDIYLEFQYSKLNLAAFDKMSDKLEYNKEQLYKSYLSNKEDINFNELKKLVEENIHQMEKSIDEFVKDIYLIIETPETMTIKISVLKYNEGKRLIREDVMYLVQDAKQQILKSNSNIEVIHIIVEKYILDNFDYNFLPLEKECKKFSIDIMFVCFPKDLLINFEKFFSKQQISINKFICFNYLKKFNSNNITKNSCILGREIVNGINKQEVVSIPKIVKKKGFFEKLFHFFR
tara:strand:- start:30 stop:743 length:714 start_codon:yes stop_codon:yes gene_type:complete